MFFFVVVAVVICKSLRNFKSEQKKKITREKCETNMYTSLLLCFLGRMYNQINAFSYNSVKVSN